MRDVEALMLLLLCVIYLMRTVYCSVCHKQCFDFCLHSQNSRGKLHETFAKCSINDFMQVEFPTIIY